MSVCMTAAKGSFDSTSPASRSSCRNPMNMGCGGLVVNVLWLAARGSQFEPCCKCFQVGPGMQWVGPLDPDECNSSIVNLATITSGMKVGE